MNLYGLSNRVRELLDKIELTEAENQELESLCAGIEHKVDAICTIIAEEEGDMETVQKEYSRLQGMVQARRNKIARLKRYIMDSLRNMGQSAHKTAHWSVRIQKNPERAVMTVNGPEELPREWQNTIIEPATKKAIEHYKSTGQVPDGFRIEQGEHLRIT